MKHSNAGLVTSVTGPKVRNTYSSVPYFFQKPQFNYSCFLKMLLWEMPSFMLPLIQSKWSNFYCPVLVFLCYSVLLMCKYRVWEMRWRVKCFLFSITDRRNSKKLTRLLIFLENINKWTSLNSHFSKIRQIIYGIWLAEDWADFLLYLGSKDFWPLE